MTILPFQEDDIVQWFGKLAVVASVRGERIVVDDQDGVAHITTEKVLREHQLVWGAAS